MRIGKVSADGRCGQAAGSGLAEVQMREMSRGSTNGDSAQRHDEETHELGNLLRPRHGNSVRRFLRDHHRDDDVVTTGITTAVVLVVAAISPRAHGNKRSCACSTPSWASLSLLHASGVLHLRSIGRWENRFSDALHSFPYTFVASGDAATAAAPP